MNNKIILTTCIFIFAISCHKSGNEPPSPVPFNPKQYTAQMEGKHTWKTLVRHHCLPCNPIYDSSFWGGEIELSLVKVLDDSTVYLGTIAYNKLTKNDFLHYINHQENEKYIFFECPKGIYINRSLKYYYNEDRVELLLKSDSAGFRGVDVLYISL
ncbi:MAG: hypothetical protein K9G49_06370 [Taibaiella sp.]|nr:hypothetical protein [Taibaiella sp.]